MATAPQRRRPKGPPAKACNPDTCERLEAVERELGELRSELRSETRELKQRQGKLEQQVVKVLEEINNAMQALPSFLSREIKASFSAHENLSHRNGEKIEDLTERVEKLEKGKDAA